MSDDKTPAAGPLEPPKVKRRPGSPTGDAHGVPVGATDSGAAATSTPAVVPDPEPEPAAGGEGAPAADPAPVEMPTVQAPDPNDDMGVDTPGAGLDAERIKAPRQVKDAEFYSVSLDTEPGPGGGKIEHVSEPATATPEGLQEVIAVARRATAHNYGETVWEYAILDPRTYMLRMSSWPRANEARDGLRAAGYECEHMPPDGGHPRLTIKVMDTILPGGGSEPHPVEVRIPAAPDWVFSEAAVAGLVGQTVKVLSRPGDWESMIGRGEVVAARSEPDGVYVTLDVTPFDGTRITDALTAAVGLPEIPTTEGTPVPDVSSGFQSLSHRDVQVFDSVRMFEVGPVAGPPPKVPRVQMPRTHGQEYDGDPEQGGKPL